MAELPTVRGPSRSDITTLIDALPDPALLFGADRRLVRANAAARAVFSVRGDGYTPAQTLASAQLAGAVDEARTARTAVEVDATVGDREFSALATPVGDEVLLLIRDQTERRRVDAVRRDFVANASHELKTPVSGIQALAEAIVVTLDRGNTQRGRELSHRLADEAVRLGRLVTELLALRRLEEVGEFGTAPVDLSAIVREEVEQVTDRAASRGIGITVDVPEQAVVIGAEADLRLILANLLDNAVGYNRDGGRVDVALRRLDGAWRFEIADTGIGIPRQDLDRIFERFYRVDIARSRAGGGTGLGLAIVRHATERHGGSVVVDSILGEGSTFAVTIPVEPSP